ncbi:MAG TPA: sigma factor-like helix-turn-helix DNA-binding protein [Candidatus Hydrogenedentes bacterium]|nr:hypothetical protein [Candidatus Hydrogenedentota bacterium]HOJ69377.1 sigma factor-like helix-turn-helix DNA-binding protein [Candidatus Hydrogenedentota bacterium]HOK89827.1 sigma factor-like helix-turn-helix DNA-binding protein [Candidatus Hydrogenedentota bacterium]
MKTRVPSASPVIAEPVSVPCREELVPPEALSDLPESSRLGWESPDEQRAAFRWSRVRSLLLGWVRQAMREHLSRAESESITLVYFEGLTCREAGARLGVHGSTITRRCRAGIATLRRIAETNPPRLPDGSAWRPGTLRNGRKNGPRA